MSAKLRCNLSMAFPDVAHQQILIAAGQLDISTRIMQRHKSPRIVTLILD